MRGEYSAYGKGGDIIEFRSEGGGGEETVYSLQKWGRLLIGLKYVRGKGTEIMMAGIGYIICHEMRAC